jgi:hypothetical protein
MEYQVGQVLGAENEQISRHHYQEEVVKDLLYHHRDRLDLQRVGVRVGMIR